MMEFGKKKEGKKATRKHAHLIFQISCKQTTHVMHAMFHICKHVEKTHQMKEVPRFSLTMLPTDSSSLRFAKWPFQSPSIWATHAVK